MDILMITSRINNFLIKRKMWFLVGKMLSYRKNVVAPKLRKNANSL